MENALLVINDDALPVGLKDAPAAPHIFDIPEIPPDQIAAWIRAARSDSLGSSSTRRSYQADIEDFEAWRAGRSITSELVEKYLEHRNEEAEHMLSPTYIRRILAALRWWIRSIRKRVKTEALAPALWPWRNELVNQLDEAAQVRGPRGERKTAARAGRHIPENELQALLDACLNDPNTLRGRRDLAMIAVAAVAGPRVHELSGIKVSDVVEVVDDKGLSYRINVIGKGNKEADLPVEGFGAVYLKQWLDLRGNAPGGVFPAISRWGNPRRENGRGELKPMTTEAARLILVERCEQARIDKVTTWHDFRRTMIGNLIEEEDIKIAQRAARHANVTQTADYDRRPEEETRAALRRQAERLRQTGP